MYQTGKSRKLLIVSWLLVTTFASNSVRADFPTCIKGVVYWALNEGEELVRIAKYTIKNRTPNEPKWSSEKYERLVKKFESDYTQGSKIDISEIDDSTAAAALLTVSSKAIGWDVSVLQSKIETLPAKDRKRVYRAINLVPELWIKDGKPLTYKAGQDWIATVMASIQNASTWSLKGVKDSFIPKSEIGFYKDAWEASLMNSTVPRTLEKFGIVNDPNMPTLWKKFVSSNSKFVKVVSRIAVGVQKWKNVKKGKSVKLEYPDELINKYVESGGDFNVVKDYFLKSTDSKSYEMHRIQKQLNIVLTILAGQFIANTYTQVRSSLAFDDPFPDVENPKQDDSKRISSDIPLSRSELVRVLLESSKDEFREMNGRDPEINGRDSAWWKEQVENYNALTDEALKIEFKEHSKQ